MAVISDRTRLMRARKRKKDVKCKHCNEEHWYFCVVNTKKVNKDGSVYHGRKVLSTCLTCSAAKNRERMVGKYSDKMKKYRKGLRKRIAADPKLKAKYQKKWRKHAATRSENLTDGYVRQELRKKLGLLAAEISDYRVKKYREHLQAIRA